MKRLQIIISIVIFISLAVSKNLMADETKFGAGFILGSPSGVTGKLFIDKSNAIDFGLGVVSGDDIYIYGDYLRHFNGVFPIEGLNVYFGFGPGYHKFEKDNKKKEDEKENRFEVRIPVGLEFLTGKIPLGIFLEIAPALRVVPDIDFDVRGGIGLRYYF